MFVEQPRVYYQQSQQHQVGQLVAITAIVEQPYRSVNKCSCTLLELKK